MGLRRRLARRGIDLIAPVQKTHVNNFQDQRKFRRYKRRWIIERTHAWIQNFRRLVVRWDRSLTDRKSVV